MGKMEIEGGIVPLSVFLGRFVSAQFVGAHNAIESEVFAQHLHSLCRWVH